MIFRKDIKMITRHFYKVPIAFAQALQMQPIIEPKNQETLSLRTPYC